MAVVAVPLPDDCWNTIALFVNDPALMMRVCHQWRRVILTTHRHLLAFLLQKGHDMRHILTLKSAALRLVSARLSYSSMQKLKVWVEVHGLGLTMKGSVRLWIFLSAQLSAEQTAQCAFYRPSTYVQSHGPILNKLIGPDTGDPRATISYEQFCRAAAHIVTRKPALRRVLARVCRVGNYQLLEQWRQSGRYPLSLYDMAALARISGTKQLYDHYAERCAQRRARETERRRARLAASAK
jgi:hypothetical protein